MECSGTPLWGSTLSMGNREHARQLQLLHAGQPQGAERHLIAHRPAGYKGDSKTCFHRTQDTFRSIQSHGCVQVFYPEPCFFQRLFDYPSRPRAMFACDESDRLQLSELHVLIRPLVIVRDDKNHMILHERFGANICSWVGPFNEGQVNPMLCQRRQNLIGIAAHATQQNARVVLAESSQKIGKQVLPDSLGGPHSQFVSPRPGDFRYSPRGLARQVLSADLHTLRVRFRSQ